MYLVLCPENMTLLYKVQSQSVACDLACLRDDITQHIFEVTRPADLMCYTQMELAILYRNITNENLVTTVSHEANCDTVYNTLLKLTPDVVNGYHSQTQANFALTSDKDFVFKPSSFKPCELTDPSIDPLVVHKFTCDPVTQVEKPSFKLTQRNVQQQTAPNQSTSTTKANTTATNPVHVPSKVSNWPKKGSASYDIWMACDTIYTTEGCSLKDAKLKAKDQLLESGINPSTVNVQSNKWMKYKVSENNSLQS